MLRGTLGRCAVGALGVLACTRVVLAEPARFLDAAGSTTTMVFCGDADQRHFLGQVGDYFDLGTCKAVEFRGTREGRNSLVLTGVQELFDARVAKKAVRLSVPECTSTPQFNEVKLRGQATIFPPHTIEFPIDRFINDLGGETSCIATIYKIQLRNLLRYRWEGNASSHPDGAAVLAEGLEVGKTTTRVILKFADQEEQKSLTFKLKGYVNKTVMIRSDSPTDQKVILDPIPKAPSPQPK